MPGLRPERHIFATSTEAKKVLDAEKMRGAKIVVIQSDPDNTTDVLLDIFENMEKPIQLTPGASHVLDSPPGRVGGPPFGRLGEDEEYWFEFDLVFQAVSGTPTVVVWLWKPVPGGEKRVKPR